MFGLTTDVNLWSFLIIAICFGILLIGRYKVLDTVMKVIISILTLTTIIAVTAAIGFNVSPIEWTQVLPENSTQWVFLIAFMGWMPAPLDVSVWHSLWAIEKQKTLSKPPNKNMLDFKIGYLTTVFLGICFLSLGALVMFGSGETNGLAQQAKRSMKLQVNIQEGDLMVSVDDSIVYVTPITWKDNGR